VNGHRPEGERVTREYPLPQPMTDYAVRVAQSAGLAWHRNVEFKIEQQSQIPYLMEVNGRSGGHCSWRLMPESIFPGCSISSHDGAISDDRHPYQPGVRSRWWLGDLDHLLLRWWKSDSELALPPEARHDGRRCEFPARS